MKKLITLFLAAILAVASGLFWAHITRPAYSLKQAREAVRDRDLEAFTKYVDMDSVADSYLDQALNEAASSPDSDNEAALIGRSLGMAMIQAAQPGMAANLVRQFERSLENGDLEKNVFQKSGDAVSLAYVIEEGKTALAGFETQTDKIGQTGVMEMTLRDMGSYWRITALKTNAPNRALKIPNRKSLPLCVTRAGYHYAKTRENLEKAQTAISKNDPKTHATLKNSDRIRDLPGAERVWLLSKTADNALVEILFQKSKQPFWTFNEALGCK